MPSFAHLIARLRFRHLSLLAALEEHQNLHRAAETVHLAQPTATHLLRELELLFGFPLFERLPRGMPPTEAGAEVLYFARRALIDLERLTQDLDNRRNGRLGQLVIGTIKGVALDLVARAMAEIKEQRPLLGIKLVAGTSVEIFDLLLERRIDLGIGYFGDPSRLSAVEYRLLGCESLYLVARADHPLARMRQLHLGALENCSWLLQPITSPVRQLIEQQFARSNMTTPVDFIECASLSATLQLLQRSNAVTMLPQSAVRDHLSAGLLVRLPLQMDEGLSEFGIITRRGESLSAAASEFAHSLSRELPQRSSRSCTLEAPLRAQGA